MEEHREKIIDDDARLTIDPATRAVTNEAGKLIMVQYDHNSERVTFECPRYVEGHDMLESDSVEVLYVTPGKEHGLYICDDVQTADDDKITFTWLISRNATKQSGTLSFQIRFVCLGDNETIDYEWRTAIYKKVQVAAAMPEGEAVEEIYPDVLEAWRDGVVDDVIEQVGTGGGTIKVTLKVDAEGNATLAGVSE